MLLCGVLQIGVGVLRLGKLIRIVPHPVMLGFVNGLAIVILLAQVSSFKTLGDDGALHFLEGTRLWLMLGLVALTMAIIALLPRLTKAVPSSLAAILVVSGGAVAINATSDDDPALTVRDVLVDSTLAAAVGDAREDKARAYLDDVSSVLPEGVVAQPTDADALPDLDPDEVHSALDSVDAEAIGIAGGLPRPTWWDFELPPFTLETLWIILPISVVLAGVGLIESLMTMTLVDELTETRGSGNRECVGQGVGNVACGVLGGMGGCLGSR